MTATDTDTPKLAIHGSRLFTSWLADQKASLAFTTYQAGKLFLIGMKPGGELSVFERTFDRCMGLAAGDGRLWMSSLYQLWRFENFLDPGTVADGHDAMFVPVTGHTTGDADIHDIHIRADGTPLFVVTRFNCIATLSDRGSFSPVWNPPFIDRIAAEDRCHLNGMAVQDDVPRFVTCVGRSNVAEGWRDHRQNGGLLIDVESGETVVEGLSMPHSPRVYDGQLWVLQTGTGEFGRVDIATGQFEPVCFLPGFARGLTFVGDYAVIGLSRPRGSDTFEGLALNERLKREGALAKCAICIVNLKTGDLEHRLDIDGVVQELYDVAVLPGIRRPMALGFRTEQIRFAIRPDVGADILGK
ncbi:TIGR03032 family protein [Octadecabacter sp. G9-8]|uniref:TIGR03032 family protein n=1 Tax=Octadecabacter dasysiphoniae TaxID=2909341 RepID=A0ABS9D113_9RHOB|nr:TIGR03032 family protein [Octadecabacter dasysiphoniae]